MATKPDSILDRARRVHHTLEGTGYPRGVQVAVGGPCPGCGERVEIVVHADSSGFACGACGEAFTIAA